VEGVSELCRSAAEILSMAGWDDSRASGTTLYINNPAQVPEISKAPVGYPAPGLFMLRGKPRLNHLRE
jgi:hypothetical protein